MYLGMRQKLDVQYEINSESAISCISFENTRPLFSKYQVNRVKSKRENPTPKTALLKEARADNRGMGVFSKQHNSSFFIGHVVCVYHYYSLCIWTVEFLL